MSNWWLTSFLSTNTSSSCCIAQRSASPLSLIWHTVRKNTSGKLSWWHTICTYIKASISQWSLGIKNLLRSIHWPQFSPPLLVWIGWLHHKIVGSSNVIYTSWKRRLVCFATVCRSQWYRALWLYEWCFTSLVLLMDSIAGVVISTFLLVKSWRVVTYIRATLRCPLESIARLLKTFSHGTVLLHRCKLQFQWAVQVTFPVVRFSLRWTPATQ